MTWLQTRDGHAIDLLTPDLTHVTIEEIAHSLARIARFCGHTRGENHAYSVAQHCVLVSRNVANMYALDGLLHDAKEFAIGDITSPVKAALRALDDNGALANLDDIWDRAVANRFGTAYPTPAAVKRADLDALVTERRDLMGNVEARPWGIDARPFHDPIYVWPIKVAEREFLDRFHELTKARAA